MSGGGGEGGRESRDIGRRRGRMEGGEWREKDGGNGGKARERWGEKKRG